MIIICKKYDSKIVLGILFLADGGYRFFRNAHRIHSYIATFDDPFNTFGKLFRLKKSEILKIKSQRFCSLQIN